MSKNIYLLLKHMETKVEHKLSNLLFYYENDTLHSTSNSLQLQTFFKTLLDYYFKNNPDTLSQFSSAFRPSNISRDSVTISSSNIKSNVKILLIKNIFNTEFKKDELFYYSLYNMIDEMYSVIYDICEKLNNFIENMSSYILPNIHLLFYIVFYNTDILNHSLLKTELASLLHINTNFEEYYITTYCNNSYIDINTNKICVIPGRKKSSFFSRKTSTEIESLKSLSTVNSLENLYDIVSKNLSNRKKSQGSTLSLDYGNFIDLFTKQGILNLFYILNHHGANIDTKNIMFININLKDILNYLDNKYNMKEIFLYDIDLNENNKYKTIFEYNIQKLKKYIQKQKSTPNLIQLINICDEIYKKSLESHFYKYMKTNTLLSNLIILIKKTDNTHDINISFVNKLNEILYLFNNIEYRLNKTSDDTLVIQFLELLLNYYRNKLNSNKNIYSHFSKYFSEIKFNNTETSETKIKIMKSVYNNNINIKNEYLIMLFDILDLSFFIIHDILKKIINSNYINIIPYKHLFSEYNKQTKSIKYNLHLFYYIIFYSVISEDLFLEKNIKKLLSINDLQDDILQKCSNKYIDVNKNILCKVESNDFLYSREHFNFININSDMSFFVILTLYNLLNNVSNNYYIWKPGRDYKVNEIVIHNNEKFYCKKKICIENPSFNKNDWIPYTNDYDFIKHKYNVEHNVNLNI